MPEDATQGWTPTIFSSSLSQDFFVDADTDMLSFSFLPIIGDAEEEPETDWFSFHLNGSLFYQWSSSGDETIGSGVTVIPPDDPEIDAWTTVNLSIDSVLWGSTASMEFKLDHGYDLFWDNDELLLVDLDPSTTISIDGVQLSGTPAVVPVPGALGLAVVGLSGISFFRKKIAG